MSSSRQTNQNENNNLLGKNQPKNQKGRPKIEMKKIDEPNNLNVTFSKRRSGAFKKASELCTLTGSEVVIFVFSPSNKVHSFSHPNLQTVLTRFVKGNFNPIYQRGSNNQLRVSHHNPEFLKMNVDITEAQAHLENLRNRNQEIEEQRSAHENQMQPMTLLDRLNHTQYMQLYHNLYVLTKKMDAFDLLKEVNQEPVTGSKDHGTLHGNIGSSSIMNQNIAQVFNGGSSTSSFAQHHFQYGNYGHGQVGYYGSGVQSNSPLNNHQIHSSNPMSSQDALYGTGGPNITEAPFVGSSPSLPFDNIGWNGRYNQGQQFPCETSFEKKFPSNTSFRQQFHPDNQGSSGHVENYWNGVPPTFLDPHVDGNEVSEVILSNASSFGCPSGFNVSNLLMEKDDDPDFSALYTYLDNSGPKSPQPEFDNIGWNDRYN